MPNEPRFSAGGLPSSMHTEVAILGAMLLDAVAISDATAKLRDEDFSLDSHQRIYRAILELLASNHAVDFLTVQDALAKKRELDAIGGPAYLAYLTEGIPRNLNIESYVRIVKDKSLLRQLMGIFNEGIASASDGSEDGQTVLSNVEAQLAKVADSTITKGFATVAEVVSESFGSVDALYEQGREVTGLRTHFVEFDRMTSGLQPSELTIIAGRPSMGKTAIALNIIQNCAVRDGKVVAVFSLEMSRVSLLKRMMASEAMISASAIRSGFIKRDYRERLNNALERLVNSRMKIDDSANITLAEMRSMCRRLKQKEGTLDLIVIDYLQLMTGTPGQHQKRGFENRTQEVSAISRGLKALAKELNVPVVALSQLSRASEQRSGDKKPLLSDLRESGSIEQDADVVAFIHRQEYYEPANEEVRGLAELIVAKQRNGPIGTVKLAYIAEWTTFNNLAGQESTDQPQQSSFGDAY